MSFDLILQSVSSSVVRSKKKVKFYCLLLHNAIMFLKKNKNKNLLPLLTNSNSWYFTRIILPSFRKLSAFASL